MIKTKMARIKIMIKKKKIKMVKTIRMIRTVHPQKKCHQQSANPLLHQQNKLQQLQKVFFIKNLSVVRKIRSYKINLRIVDL